MSNASEYNQAQIDKGKLSIEVITSLVRDFQKRNGLDDDGKCGPKTLTVIGAMTSKNPVDRARSVVGKRIIYKLGKGGYHPEDPFPSRSGEADCSGFVSWCLGISRRKRFGDGHEWVSTSDIYRDANGVQGLFEKIEVPEPGCLVVYPDSKVGSRTRQGHVAIVTETKPLRGVDCSMSSYKRYGDAVRERSITFFLGKRSIFCRLKEQG